MARSLTSDLIHQEHHFYSSIIPNSFFNFITRTSITSSYSYIDQSGIVVGIDSSMVYESIARGTKTAVFSARVNNFFNPFGWPKSLDDVGPFWANSVKSKDIFSYKIDDFQLIEYEHHPPIKAKMAV